MFNIKTSTSDYLSIVVTHECNKKCLFCVDKYRGSSEYITIDNVIKGLCFAESKNIKDIILTGGEPTLHQEIVKIASMVKSYGFNLIMTTNYSNPKIVRALDLYVDSFNLSFYGQELPKQNQFRADITISALINKKQLNTKDKLDEFIDCYESYGHLKFSTLSVCNAWTAENQEADFIDGISEKNVILFDEIRGDFYRVYIIKRYDRILNTKAKQSFKCHVDGVISTSWERSLNKVNK